MSITRPTAAGVTTFSHGVSNMDTCISTEIIIANGSRGSGYMANASTGFFCFAEPAYISWVNIGTNTNTAVTLILKYTKV